MKTISSLRLLLLHFLLVSTAVAGEGVTMKCSQTSCGFRSPVVFGGGMMVERIMGYCRGCKKFVDLCWGREGAPEELLKDAKLPPKPKPLGELWDAKTGAILNVYACPQCKGPFAEIRSPEQLTHCPDCNHDGFAVDESEPRMAID